MFIPFMMDIAFPYFSLFRYRSLVLLVNAMKWYSNIAARGLLWLSIFHAFSFFHVLLVWARWNQNMTPRISHVCMTIGSLCWNMVIAHQNITQHKQKYLVWVDVILAEHGQACDLKIRGTLIEQVGVDQGPENKRQSRKTQLGGGKVGAVPI